MVGLEASRKDGLMRSCAQNVGNDGNDGNRRIVRNTHSGSEREALKPMEALEANRKDNKEAKQKRGPEVHGSLRSKSERQERITDAGCDSDATKQRPLDESKKSAILKFLGYHLRRDLGHPSAQVLRRLRFGCNKATALGREQEKWHFGLPELSFKARFGPSERSGVTPAMIRMQQSSGPARRRALKRRIDIFPIVF